VLRTASRAGRPRQSSRQRYANSNTGQPRIARRPGCMVLFDTGSENSTTVAGAQADRAKSAAMPFTLSNAVLGSCLEHRRSKRHRQVDRRAVFIIREHSGQRPVRSTGMQGDVRPRRIEAAARTRRQAAHGRSAWIEVRPPGR